MNLRETLKAKERELNLKKVRTMENAIAGIRKSMEKTTDPRTKKVMEMKINELRACLGGEKRNVIGTNYRTAVGRQPA